jgi:hypothetical protein
MKRRSGQCPAKPKGHVLLCRWRCQLGTGHDGPHRGSFFYDKQHFVWTDGATVLECGIRPGALRYRPLFWTPKRFRAFTRAMDGLSIALAWLAWSLPWWCAAVYTVWVVLEWVKRPHFLDVGRFTAGIWHVRPGCGTPILSLGWVRNGPGPAGPKAGLEMVIGDIGLGVFALMPRSEWPACKRAKAERRARAKERKS